MGCQLGNILVAAKDETMRQLLDVSLQRINHAVKMADNGEEVLELIRGEKFDLVIVDYSMTGMGAMEILQNLTDNGDEIPQIMILSAKSTPDSIRECVEAGARDYVVKPFNLPVLIERIEVLLHKK
ncbi:MAG TPA: response regulator [Nitrospinota bacterium]|nr:response regulator [Nitrospinota bacterium]